MDQPLVTEYSVDVGDFTSKDVLAETASREHNAAIYMGSACSSEDPWSKPQGYELTTRCAETPKRLTL